MPRGNYTQAMVYRDTEIKTYGQGNATQLQSLNGAQESMVF